MTKKEIARKVWLAFSWVWFFYITVKFFLGKADTFYTICMFVWYSLWALDLITIIVSRIIYYKTYKALVNGFEYLKTLHKIRYKLYFTGDREEVEECSAEIDKYENILLDAGRTAISDNLLRKKHIKSVEEILNQIERLMTTTN